MTRGFGRCILPGNVAEGQAFADVAGPLLQIAVNRAQFAGAVEARDRRVVRPYGPAPSFRLGPPCVFSIEGDSSTA
jgi:hypothetical protein